MRIQENGIDFRNDVNLFNPIEMWGYRFKVDGIKICMYSDYRKLNENQTKKTENFIKKHKKILPIDIIEEFNFFNGLTLPRCNLDLQSNQKEVGGRKR